MRVRRKRRGIDREKERENDKRKERERKERKAEGDREIIDFYPILLSHPTVVHLFIYLTSSSSILIFSQIFLFVYSFLFLSLVVFILFSFPSHSILFFYISQAPLLQGCVLANQLGSVLFSVINFSGVR